MIITKSKDYSYIDFESVKQALRLSEDASSDAEVNIYIQTAIQQIEAFIWKDVVPTVATVEDYCFSGDEYTLKEPNVTVSAVTITDTSGNTTSITGFSIQKYSTKTVIKFASSVDAATIHIVYTSGKQELDAAIQAAMFIKVREMFDSGDQYISSSVQNTMAFEKLLSSQMKLI